MWKRACGEEPSTEGRTYFLLSKLYHCTYAISIVDGLHSYIISATSCCLFFFFLSLVLFKKWNALLFFFYLSILFLFKVSRLSHC